MPSAGPARLALAVLAACTLALAGCTSTGSTGQPAAATTSADDHSPQTTTEADSAPVADALGRTGTLQNGTVYRVAFPRKDLTVTSQGGTINPGFALGGYAAFARYDDGTIVMGDLVVTEEELPKVTDALQAAGIKQTAVQSTYWSRPRRSGGPTSTRWVIPPRSPADAGAAGESAGARRRSRTRRLAGSR